MQLGEQQRTPCKHYNCLTDQLQIANILLYAQGQGQRNKGQQLIIYLFILCYWFVDEPVGGDLSNAGDDHLAAHRAVEPAELLEQLHGGVRDLDLHRLRGGLHQRRDVDGVAEHGEVRHLGADHAAHAAAGVDPHPHLHLVVAHVAHLQHGDIRIRGQGWTQTCKR